MINSISGINLKIGADLSDLKKEVGKVGDEVKEGLKPAEEPVKTLKDNFKESATNAAKTALSAAAVAVALGKIGKALTGFTKGIVEDAIAIDPETQKAVEDVKTAYDDVKKALAESIAPVIKEVAPILTEMLQNVSKWIRENPETAANLIELAGGFGLLASAASVAAPALMMLNIGLAPISGTALVVATTIAGLAAIIGLLIDRSDELTSHTQATAESIETMDTTSQKLVENGYGQLEIWDKTLITNDEGKLGYYEDYAGWDGLPVFVEVQQDAAAAVSETSEAVAEQTEAITEAGTAAESAEEILQNMRDTMGIGDTSAETGGMVDAMTQMTDLLENEAFKQFASQPVSEDVATSWSEFGDSITATAEGFSTLSELGEQDTFVLPTVGEDVMTSWQNFAAIFAGNEEEGTVGLVAQLTNVKTETDGILTSMQNLAAYMQGDFVSAIGVLIEALCVVTTDEEGNTKANGGNTLYNALGSISKVLGDILNNTQRIVQEWTGSFVPATEDVKKASGKAEGALDALQTSANNTASAFSTAAAAVLELLAALQELDNYKRNRSGGSSTGSAGSGIIAGAVASGGPVVGGSTYLVGEEGPELFTPRHSGTIIPNDELMGRGDSITVNVEGSIYGESYLENYVVGKLTKAVRNELILAS